MNSLAFLLLQVRLAKSLFGLESEIRSPQRAGGVWWLDLRLGERHVVFAWCPQRGYGVSLNTEATGYGEGFDHTFSELEEAYQKACALLKGY